jgi:hypothetical protein
MISKTIKPFILTCMFFSQMAFSQVSLPKTNTFEPSFTSKTVSFDTLTSFKNGVITHTEISDDVIIEIKIDFNTGYIDFSTTNTDGVKQDNTLHFDPTTIQYSEKELDVNLNNAKPIEYTKTLNVIGGVSVKLFSGCGSLAGKLLDLAIEMIAEGEATNNSALIAAGKALRQIAIDLFAQCLRQ